MKKSEIEKLVKDLIGSMDLKVITIEDAKPISKKGQRISNALEKLINESNKKGK